MSAQVDEVTKQMHELQIRLARAEGREEGLQMSEKGQTRLLSKYGTSGEGDGAEVFAVSTKKSDFLCYYCRRKHNRNECVAFAHENDGICSYNPYTCTLTLGTEAKHGKYRLFVPKRILTNIQHNGLSYIEFVAAVLSKWDVPGRDGYQSNKHKYVFPDVSERMQLEANNFYNALRNPTYDKLATKSHFHDMRIGVEQSEFFKFERAEWKAKKAEEEAKKREEAAEESEEGERKGVDTFLVSVGKKSKPMDNQGLWFDVEDSLTEEERKAADVFAGTSGFKRGRTSVDLVKWV